MNLLSTLPCRMKSTLVVLFLLVGISCRERYNVPLSTLNTGYLVVEGVINPSGKTSVTLSRTTKLDDRNIIHESGAILEIQGDDNSSYPLTESDSGVYLGPEITLNNNANYRLHIRTSNNKEYISGYSKPLVTPVIDSISWTRENRGVNIFLTAHDPENKIDYYKWDYEETFQFKSYYETGLKYDIRYNGPDVVYAGLAGRDSTDNLPGIGIRICWKSQHSSNLVIGSTADLSQKLIFTAIKSYPKDAFELSQLYSINIRQYALSKDAYQYYLKMKKNTESLGTIFDPLPSEIKGNITCVSDPAEQVIGYVEAATVQTKRKFIAVSELPDWFYNEQCQTDTMPLNTPNVLAAFYKGFYPLTTLLPPSGIVLFVSTPVNCADCTTRGTNLKPSFWP